MQINPQSQADELGHAFKLMVDSNNKTLGNIKGVSISGRCRCTAGYNSKPVTCTGVLLNRQAQLSR